MPRKTWTNGSALSREEFETEIESKRREARKLWNALDKSDDDRFSVD